MAVFRVGQRVRIVRHLWGKEIMRRMVGSEGVIDTPLQEDAKTGFIVHGIQLTKPSAPWPLDTKTRDYMICTPDELEPIVDDGREVVAWKTCDWMPEHLRETEPA